MIARITVEYAKTSDQVRTAINIGLAIRAKKMPLSSNRIYKDVRFIEGVRYQININYRGNVVVKVLG
jgi:hypothetical protein